MGAEKQRVFQVEGVKCFFSESSEMDRVNNAKVKAYKLYISHVKWLQIKNIKSSEPFLVFGDLRAFWHEEHSSSCYDL